MSRDSPAAREARTSSVVGVEGLHPSVEALVQIASKRVAAITVHSVLRASLARLGLPPSIRSPEELELLIVEVMKGLRIFCDPVSLPHLMLELAALIEGAETRYFISERVPIDPNA